MGLKRYIWRGITGECCGLDAGQGSRASVLKSLKHGSDTYRGRSLSAAGGLRRKVPEEASRHRKEIALARNHVQAFREGLMMSKAELARKAGLSALTIDRVEAGRPCRLETKRKILLALGLKVSDKERLFGPGLNGGERMATAAPESRQVSFMSRNAASRENSPEQFTLPLRGRMGERGESR